MKNWVFKRSSGFLSERGSRVIHPWPPRSRGNFPLSPTEEDFYSRVGVTLAEPYLSLSLLAYMGTHLPFFQILKKKKNSWLSEYSRLWFQRNVFLITDDCCPSVVPPFSPQIKNRYKSHNSNILSNSLGNRHMPFSFANDLMVTGPSYLCHYDVDLVRWIQMLMYLEEKYNNGWYWCD